MGFFKGYRIADTGRVKGTWFIGYWRSMDGAAVPNDIGTLNQSIRNKLIDIGFCRVSQNIEKFLDGFQDIGRSEVANPRQSTCATKIYVNNYVDKSTIAQFYLFGFYWPVRKTTTTLYV